MDYSSQKRRKVERLDTHGLLEERISAHVIRAWHEGALGPVFPHEVARNRARLEDLEAVIFL